MIRKNKNKETKPDFEEMMIEVKEDIQEQDAEQEIISRVPELKLLSNNIDKATTTWLSATYELESAIQQYQRAEKKLDATVTDICGKVDGINDHIDKVLKDAPTKLQVSVNVADADWQKIQALFDQQHQWMLTKMQVHCLLMIALYGNLAYTVHDGTERKKAMPSTMQSLQAMSSCYFVKP